MALPAAFATASTLPAALLLGGTAVLNLVSLWYVAAAAKLSGATNYGELALCWGRPARLAMVSASSSPCVPWAAVTRLPRFPRRRP